MKCSYPSCEARVQSDQDQFCSNTCANSWFQSLLEFTSSDEEASSSDSETQTEETKLQPPPPDTPVPSNLKKN